MKIINESHHNNTISDIFFSFESEIEHASCLSHESIMSFSGVQDMWV